MVTEMYNTGEYVDDIEEWISDKSFLKPT